MRKTRHQGIAATKQKAQDLWLHLAHHVPNPMLLTVLPTGPAMKLQTLPSLSSALTFHSSLQSWLFVLPHMFFFVSGGFHVVHTLLHSNSWHPVFPKSLISKSTWLLFFFDCRPKGFLLFPKDIYYSNSSTLLLLQILWFQQPHREASQFLPLIPLSLNTFALSPQPWTPTSLMTTLSESLLYDHSFSLQRKGLQTQTIFSLLLGSELLYLPISSWHTSPSCFKFSITTMSLQVHYDIFFKFTKNKFTVILFIEFIPQFSNFGKNQFPWCACMNENDLHWS